VLQAANKRNAATADFERAVAMLGKFFGGDHPNQLEILVPLAEMQLAKGDSASAVATLEHALAICERARITGFWLAHTQAALARARKSTH
jgi:hypothetical protein